MTLKKKFQFLKATFTSCAKAGDDKRKEGKEEGGGGGKEGDLHGLVELVGEEDEEHQERHYEEAVAQGRVGRGPSVILKRYINKSMTHFVNTRHT